MAIADAPMLTGLPPRPPLPRFQMSVGFMLTPTKFFDACHERCGDWFTLRPQADRILVVTVDPEAVRQVFTGDPDLLYAGEGNVILEPILGPSSTLLLDGPEHLRHRRLLLAPLHGERMRAYGDTMARVAEREIAALPRGRTFAALPVMQAITLEVIMRVVFGVRDHELLERLGTPLRALLDTVASRRRVLALAVTAERGTQRGPWARFLRARQAADALLYEIIEDHRRAGAQGDDILSLLLAARDEEGRPLTDAELRDELMTLLLAGHETTATALTWTLERLSHHPELVAELEAEQREGGETPLLDATIKEVLRLRPVVPAVVRRLKAPMTFGPWDLPEGVHIAPSIYLLHRRPDLYPDPLAFRPQRFLERSYGTYEWIPFGGGVRRCLGAAFATYEMKVVLSTLLRDARLRAEADGGGEGTTRRAITFAPARGGRISLRSA